MARQARVKSATGIYHVMLKGLDGRNIFLDDADRSIFMGIWVDLRGFSKERLKVNPFTDLCP